MKDSEIQLDLKRIPKHIAIIMDGNRRWAEQRSLPILDGHRAGAGVIESITDNAHSIGVEALSIFAFSTENWSRPKSEIKGLWDIFYLYIKKKRDELIERGVNIRFCGFYDDLPADMIETIEEITESTKNNNKIILNMCLNYGGRQDIIHAVNGWLETRKPEEKFTPEKLEKHLLTSGLPEIDLLIRTSGEYRISNFLIWQIAYSELVFFDVLWPDFTSHHLFKAIYEYQNRERRYGGWIVT